MSGTVELSRPDATPEYLNRRIELILPSKLRLRAGRVRKNLFVSDLGAGPADQGVAVGPRKITVNVIPHIDDEGPYGGDPLELRYRLKRGALKPIPKKLRRKRLTFRVKARYALTPFGSLAKWNGPNTGSTTTRVRPAKLRPHKKR